MWILGHAPPGVDHYSEELAYHAVYSDRYFALTGGIMQCFYCFGNLLLIQWCADYYRRGVIRASMFGHEHTIQERNATAADAVMFLQGSVSSDKVFFVLFFWCSFLGFTSKLYRETIPVYACTASRMQITL